MDNYIVSARKYRPATFDSVVGQAALTTTLKNAISTGKLAHAYLFCGPRGVGKTTCARIFAKTINCLHPKTNGEACGECESCVAFNEGRNYNIYELDAASNNSVEDIRQLISQVSIPPQVGRYKVYIIDEVHMLSQAAFNAFLKTLEEPPAHVVFILATTEKHKILPTILSRCQIFDFNRMEVTDIIGHLKHVADAEGINYEEDALAVIAQKADGGMRDAMSIFDQVAGFTGGNITYKRVIEDLNVLDYDYFFSITDSLLKSDIPSLLLSLNEILSKGFEGNHFITGLASHFRDLLVSRDAQTLSLLEVSNNVRERYQEQAARCQPKFLYKALRLCNRCDVDYRTSSNKRLLVELTLIEIAQAAQPDEDEACGLGPTNKLKPLFQTNAADNKTVVAAPTTPTPATQPASAESPTVPQPGPKAATPHSPRPLASPVSDNAQATPSNLLRPKTLSIRHSHDSQQAAQRTQAQNPKSIANEKSGETEEHFDQSALSYHWHRFAADLPKEQAAMAGRMKNMMPEIKDNWAIEVPVENDLVVQYMEGLRANLTAYLRENLHNSHITLSFSLLRSSNQKAYTRNEVYTMMLKQNAVLSRLVDTFKLELA